jgi:hypothetical protein
MSHPFQTASDVSKQAALDAERPSEGITQEGQASKDFGEFMRGAPPRTAYDVSSLGKVRSDISESTAKDCLAELERRFREQAEPYIAALAAAAAMQPAKTPIFCGGCRMPITFDPILGSRCECAKNVNVKVVREALEHVGERSFHVGWWNALAERETDENLLLLRRLLRP